METNEILPLDYDKKNKKKFKFESLEKMKQQEDNVTKEGGSSYFEFLENKFITDCQNLGFDKENIMTLAKKGVMTLDINFAFEFLSTQQKLDIKKKKKCKKEEIEDGETWNIKDEENK